MVSMHTSPSARAGTGDAGGMNVSLLATAVELAARGVEVDLLTRAIADPSATLIAPGVTLHELRAGPRGELPKSELPTHSDEFGESVSRLLGRGDVSYDIIHAHYWLSGIATLPVALELGLPFVQSFHTLGAMKNRRLAKGDKPEPERRVLSERFLAGQADAIIAGSSAEVASLIDQVGAPPGKVWVIPPGVDGDLFSPERAAASASIRAKFGLETGRPVIVVVGRVQPLKGQDLAIRAVGALSGVKPILAIVGSPTPGAEPFELSLRSLAAELGIGDDVRFLGGLDRNDLAELLASSALTLLPSHSETFGLVALESAATGTPVIGSRSTGLVESIADGISGLLLPSRDPEVWAAGISGLLSNPRKLLELSSTARAHAERFSWGTAAASLIGVYASLKRS